ncbi:patatin-like phospholipase family protein [Peptoniphilus mikwangii]|uniref:patatin-like phospholipase family protein n=1 Tax=Peptoniphilus mikwangii TaxID=1354300 RepID=UPI000413AB45|nr:patatin-like phospholipase family protein [Peptoniphilus mikwangii]
MYGLVLEGGGAKGAYHIGSYFALKELGFEFEAVVGTSIGAINGAMIVMNEPDKCANLWKSMSFQDFSTDDSDTTNAIVALMSENTQDGKFSFEKFKGIKETLSSRGIPVDPLRQLVTTYIDEEKVRNSKIKFGLTTLNLTDKKGEELFIDEIEEGKLHNYIIGSCYLPIFKLEPLDGKYYLDGGFFNKIPYNMVQRLGLTPVIVRVNPSNLRDIAFPDDAIVISPSKKYTTSMDFDPKKADEIMRIGYFDTYKKLNGLFGDKYYINPFDEEMAFEILQNMYFDRLDEILISGKYKNTSKYRVFFEEIIPGLAKELGLKSGYNYVDLVVAMIERDAQKYNIDFLRIYNVDELLNEIMSKEPIINREIEVGTINKLVKKMIKQ